MNGLAPYCAKHVIFIQLRNFWIQIFVCLSRKIAVKGKLRLNIFGFKVIAFDRNHINLLIFNKI